LFFLKKRTKNISPAGLQLVENWFLNIQLSGTTVSGPKSCPSMNILFFLKKEPKTLALRGFKSLEICFSIFNEAESRALGLVRALIGTFVL
jgi:hypothetical protein